jgi:hypothetical protein
MGSRSTFILSAPREQDLFVLSIVRRKNSDRLIASACAGDGKAQATISVVFSWLTDYRSGRHRDCITCGGVFRVTPPGLVVLLPISLMTGTRRLHEAIVGGICGGCCTRSDGDLIELSLAALAESYEIREIGSAHLASEGGRA